MRTLVRPGGATSVRGGPAETAADVAGDSKPAPQVTGSNPVESPAAPEQQQKKSPAKRSADESEKPDTDAPAQDTQESAKPEEPAD